ncbi:MAG: hypothetical protein IJN40_06315 [Clostridia bacterium]|nr:hypothetical protein [Clostridia bacterium]
MGAFSGAQYFFRHPLVEVAQRLGYAQDNLLILQGDIQTLQNQFPETYRNIMSCRHHRDNRTPLEYAQDLVASWLVEDSFLDVLNSNGLHAKLGGADRNRRILANVRTSASSDFTVYYNGNSRRLELMNDYKGYWEQNGLLHLRDSKYKSLTAEQSLFLALSFTTREFQLFDFSESTPARFIPSHFPYGGKPAYEINITKNMMQVATPFNITEAIKLHL